MKIGLITFHDTTNFGSFLQTYGLYKTLLNMGYNCEVIDYKCKAIVKKELPKKKPLNYSIREIVKFILIDRMTRKKYKSFYKAIKNTFHLSKEYNIENISESNMEYDVFLVGSDILWNREITNGDMTYFLDFVNSDKIKNSFATSIGEPWSLDEEKMISPLLKSFNHIALREKDSIEWVKKLYEKEIYSVCDPTMLLNTNEWDKFLTNYAQKFKNYILVYFYNEVVIEDAKKYAKIHKAEVVVINYGLPIKGVKNVHPYEIGDFLGLIKNAKSVFTSSYHGMLFSIYYEIPFICYGRKNGNNVRFTSVLKRLEIENNYVTSAFNFSEININYNRVSAKVEEWRKESLDILKGYWEE